MEIGSYPSIYNLGHKALDNLFVGPVQVEEKIDGSQFSFTRVDGVTYFKSKGKQLDPNKPEKMFAQAVFEISKLALHEGWIYRGECLNTPRHNVLTYARVPVHNVIIFDIETSPGTQQYLNFDDRRFECRRLGLEFVTAYFIGTDLKRDELNAFLLSTSALGNVQVEGVVIKNYTQFDNFKHRLTAKLVNDSFKEVHRQVWKTPGMSFLDDIIGRYSTEARWQKAVQHLNEQGVLTGTMKDIPALLKETQQDILKEEAENIAHMLWKEHWPNLSKGMTKGIPAWYKHKLEEKVFEQLEATSVV